MLRTKEEETMTPPESAAAILAVRGPGRSILDIKPNTEIVSQGMPCDAVHFIHKGKVRLGVVSGDGKEAVIGILTAGDFFGEACLSGRTTYHSSAISMTPCTVVRIEREAMIRLLNEQPIVSDAFMRFLLVRSFRIQADLVDQLFNSSERRLARALLQLADFEADAAAEKVIPRVNQDVLAAKVGTTRSRVNFFMNKFRKLRLIDYDTTSGTLKVRRSLLDAVINCD